MTLETRHGSAGSLEIRQSSKGRTLNGIFPYGSTAVISDRGRRRKERFEARAFEYAIADQSRDIDILIGHDFGKPIASRKAGTLTITDDAEAVRFEALLPPDPPSWVVDAQKAIAAGLMKGLSPGFLVPPASAVPDAERLVPEPGNPDVMIRSIAAAVLREMSLVTAAAYRDAEIDLRSETDESKTLQWRRRLWL